MVIQISKLKPTNVGVWNIQICTNFSFSCSNVNHIKRAATLKHITTFDPVQFISLLLRGARLQFSCDTGEMTG